MGETEILLLLGLAGGGLYLSHSNTAKPSAAPAASASTFDASAQSNDSVGQDSAGYDPSTGTYSANVDGVNTSYDPTTGDVSLGGFNLDV